MFAWLSARVSDRRLRRALKGISPGTAEKLAAIMARRRAGEKKADFRARIIAMPISVERCPETGGFIVSRGEKPGT